eukprot:TRINITY_DN17_c0_g1_i2.p1 TRINITY_DN17_c0_g1~~TRINITY_DN17_c0_g1_i2.p1  ORF type:complete len:244 (+),score=49.50 TRINITY_DN17_c0_g1_i2:522-1253(+)
MSSTKEVCVQVTRSADSGLVWSAEDAYHLRSNHRLIGNFVGTLQTHPQQNRTLGLPLLLMPEELALALCNCWVTLRPSLKFGVEPDEVTGARSVNSGAGWTYPRTEAQWHRYRVFVDLWSRGYYLSPGSKFGGDFLVYPGDPLVYHAHFVIMVRKWADKLTCSELIVFGRLGVTVKKCPVIAGVKDTAHEVENDGGGSLIATTDRFDVTEQCKIGGKELGARVPAPSDDQSIIYTAVEWQGVT